MTIREALEIVDYYDTVGCEPFPCREKAFEDEEAMRYLANITKDDDYIFRYATNLSIHGCYDAALNYFLSISNKGKDVNLTIANIYNHDKQDYQKAYEYYCIAERQGSLDAKYKIAIMYLKGRYVKQDYQKYCEILEDLYLMIIANNLDQYPSSEEEFDHYEFVVPYVLMALGHVRKEAGKNAEAMQLYAKAMEGMTDLFGSDCNGINFEKWYVQS